MTDLKRMYAQLRERGLHHRAALRELAARVGGRVSPAARKAVRQRTNSRERAARDVACAGRCPFRCPPPPGARRPPNRKPAFLLGFPDGPCRNRTYNLEIKSLLLCQLS
jgi:hypothetical protein